MKSCHPGVVSDPLLSYLLLELRNILTKTRSMLHPFLIIILNHNRGGIKKLPSSPN
jgi:hypothetical protein